MGSAFCGALLVSAVALQSTASAQAAEGFIPGEATATANTINLGLSPGGGKPITVGLGNAVARYQNATATSEGTAMSLGLLELFLGPTSQCSELPPFIPAEQLPPITTADSRRAAVLTTPLEVKSPGNAAGPGGVIGTQIAAATATPQVSTANTTTVSQDFGVVALDGGTTQVTTSLNGNVREAKATTTGTRLRIFGDVFVLNNPKWEAVARSGAVESVEGTFTFTSATIFGIDRPVSAFKDEFLSLAGGISQMLGFLGLVIEYPQVVVDGTTISVTPLSIGVQNPPIGLDFIKPLLAAIAPMKDETWANLISEDCNNQGVLQVADLAIGILSGTGAVKVNVGGVTAFTAATEFPDPPALEIGTLEPIAAPEVLDMQIVAPEPMTDFGTDNFVSPSIGSDFSSSLGDVADLAPMPEMAPIVETTAPPTTEAADMFSLPTADLSTKQYKPGKTGGAATVVGALGVIGLIGLAGADRFIMRRTKREIAD